MEAAKALDRNAYLIVLLGRRGGLRCGEIMALEWSDVDLGKAAALRAALRLEGPRHGPEGRTVALRAADGSVGGGPARRIGTCGRARALSTRMDRRLTQTSCRTTSTGRRRAQLVDSGVHRLRHTFCSHLAMRGAPARAIQEFAGHRISRRRSGTCTSVPRRSKARFGCWIGPEPPENSGDIWRRDLPRSLTRFGRISLVGGVDGTRTRGLRRDRHVLEIEIVRLSRFSSGFARSRYMRRLGLRRTDTSCGRNWHTYRHSAEPLLGAFRGEALTVAGTRSR